MSVYLTENNFYITKTKPFYFVRYLTALLMLRLHGVTS
jgi:hypothetical protein